MTTLGNTKSELRALSVRQPWAWLIVNAYKPIENRTRNTNFRGFFYVHASKWPHESSYREVQIFDSICDHVEKHFGISVPVDQCLRTRGRIIGLGNLKQVVAPGRSVGRWHERECFGWVIHDARPIAPAFECKGALGFFKLSIEMAEALLRASQCKPQGKP